MTKIRAIAFALSGLLLACSRSGNFEPLSDCPQPYSEVKLSEAGKNALGQTAARAAISCSKTKYGCSMDIDSETISGVSVTVIPVAGKNKDGCTYASDTQVYYRYDTSGKFIGVRPGMP